MNRAHPLMPSPAAAMTIRTMSDAIAGGGAQNALFLRDESNSLANVIERMEAKGYQVSAPVRAPQAPRLQGSVAWQVTITFPREGSHVGAAGALLFYIPEDVS